MLVTPLKYAPFVVGAMALGTTAMFLFLLSLKGCFNSKRKVTPRPSLDQLMKPMTPPQPTTAISIIGNQANGGGVMANSGVTSNGFIPPPPPLPPPAPPQLSHAIQTVSTHTQTKAKYTSGEAVKPPVSEPPRVMYTPSEAVKPPVSEPPRVMYTPIGGAMGTNAFVNGNDHSKSRKTSKASSVDSGSSNSTKSSGSNDSKTNLVKNPRSTSVDLMGELTNHDRFKSNTDKIADQFDVDELLHSNDMILGEESELHLADALQVVRSRRQSKAPPMDEKKNGD